ncbi:hypothetical protein [Streptomyces sp. NBC_01262]|uniref:hypothetical protein n=1 Tax=Streptomyces sp. NBC_01262 TaxID=2903803 RepID=UPI002E30600F|nr:hypothetical protein [Streptomyces sp. NBC_01262]
MNADLITAAVLGTPAAVVAPALAIAMYRTRKATTDTLAALAAHRAQTDTTAPPEGGEPLPAPGGDLATVLPFPNRRAA